VSKVNDIKNMKRQQKVITPSQVLAETVGEEEKETNVVLNQETNETRKEAKKVERKRVSFDLRTDLHKELKMQALLQDKNIYILIEEALEKYLKANK
jgi:predicted HicB family RNase H-like nuclease